MNYGTKALLAHFVQTLRCTLSFPLRIYSVNATKFTVSLKSLSSFLLGLRIDFLLALPIYL